MKKFLCMLCCLAILFGMVIAAIPASAKEIAPSGSSSKIYFDTANIGWRDYQRICCFLFDLDEGEIIVWGSKKGYCTDEGNGIWSLDLDENGISLDEGGSYYVIFSADWDTRSTYPLLLDSTCCGDTAYFTGNMIENPADSTKISCEAVWKNADPSRYGPVLMITSIGNVTGSVCAPSTAPYMMFIDFLKNMLYNARAYSGKDDQTLLDDTASALGLGARDVESAIAEAGVSVGWDRAKSSLPDSGTGGDYPGSDTTPFTAFCRYLSSNEFAEVVRQNPNKSDQQLIDEAAATYGLYQDDVERALSLIGAGDVGWSKEKSTLPEGMSGYQYTVGAYYLVINYKNGESVVNENNQMTYDENSGYYYIYDIETEDKPWVGIYQNDRVSVVRFNENRRFTVESESSIAVPSVYGMLFFFRPEEDGYNFGFNYMNEWSNSSSASSGTSGSYFVRIEKTQDDVSGVKISWYDYAGASGYEVFRYSGEWVSVGKTTQTSFVDTTAQSGCVYRYTVVATDASGAHISSNPGEQVSHRYIGAPKITSLSCSADGITVNFKGVGGNARYRIYVKDGIFWKAIGDTYGTSFLHKAKENPASVSYDPYPAPTEVSYSTGSSTTGGSYSSGDSGGFFYMPFFEDIPAEEGKVYNYRVRCVSYNGRTELGAYIKDGVGTKYYVPESQYIFGDVDGDSVVSVIDATKIQKFKAQLLTEKDINLDAADTDGDGYVTVLDATRIQKYKAQLMNLDGSTPYRG